MAAISKLQFYENVGPEVTCQFLYHNWTSSCVLGNLKLFPVYLRGIIFFYLPLYLAKMLIEYKKVDRNYLKKTLKAYIKSISYACALACLVLSSICAMCTLTGRIHYYFLGMLPGLVSGLSILFESTQNQKLNSLLWLGMAVEAFFNNAQYYKIINFTKTTQTLLYMAVSSLLMNLLVNSAKKEIPLNIWIYQPPNKEFSKNQRCNHDRRNVNVPCANYCWNESVKYFGLGFALNAAKSVISRFGKIVKNPKMLVRLILNQKNLRFAAFLGGYVGLYRVISCFLFKLNGGERFFNSAIAGFLAGSTYYFKPTINILAIAIVTLIQVSLNKSSKIRKIVAKIPNIQVLFYMLANAVLFHNRIAHFETCPRYYTNMLHIGSAGLFTRVYADLLRSFKLTT